MRYAYLVYHDPESIAHLSETDQLAAIVDACNAAAAWNTELARGGHLVFSAGLQNVRTATTVRVRNGMPSITDGPFAETKEFLGGFTIIEARDLSEALRLVSQLGSPLLTVEVRPVVDAKAQPKDPFDQKVAAAIDRCTSAEPSP